MRRCVSAQARLSAGLIATFVSLLLTRGWDTPSLAQESNPNLSQTRRLLREASQLARNEPESERYWTMRVLLRIGELQVLADDLDGAHLSIQASDYIYWQKIRLAELAERYAAEGQLKKAQSIAKPLDRQRHLADRILLQWLEHLVRHHRITEAEKTFRGLVSAQYQASGHCKLAGAFAMKGESEQAATHISNAIAAAEQMNGPAQAIAFREIAETQHKIDNASGGRATMERLVELASRESAFKQAAMLNQAAAYAIDVGDAAAARERYRKSAKALQPESANSRALAHVVSECAAAGFIDTAIATLAHFRDDYTSGADLDRSRLAIVEAQLQAKDTVAAMSTAKSIDRYLQYRSDALLAITKYEAAHQNFRAALAAAKEIPNPTLQAAGLLHVAAAQARAEESKSAEQTAASIQLIRNDRTPGKFDPQRASTWGVNYDLGPSVRATTLAISSDRTDQLATAALAYGLAIPNPPPKLGDQLLRETRSAEVAFAFGKSWATNGKTDDAVRWARGIDFHDDSAMKNSWRLQQRINALAGVSAGLLEKVGKR